jgi:hypothetical protein
MVARHLDWLRVCPGLGTPGWESAVLLSICVETPCATLHELKLGHHLILQDDLYRADYYQPLMQFRDQTYQRLKKYAAQKFFMTHHYLSGAPLSHSARSNLCWQGEKTGEWKGFVLCSSSMQSSLAKQSLWSYCDMVPVSHRGGDVQIHDVSWLALRC